MPTLQIPALLSAPRGSHSGDTTWLRSVQGAWLGGCLPRLPSMVPHAGKEGVHVHGSDQAQRAEQLPRHHTARHWRSGS